MMQVKLSTNSLDDYRTLMKIKQLPVYRICGHMAEFPDEYASLLGIESVQSACSDYVPHPQAFDYQSAISELSIRKKKFAAFCECGLGKTLILLEFAKHCVGRGKRTLIVSPLMVIPQTIAEAERFYSDALKVEQIAAKDLQGWLDGEGPAIGIVNYDAIRPSLVAGNLGAMILDESSMLKSAYGKWATKLLELGRGLEYKLCCTGTPAPNDRIEYANHAVFLDREPTVNAFLARYFVNRGQTSERWELKPHALRPFYRSLSDWCIFLSDPTVYGWRDNSETIPPIQIHIEDVPLTREQRDAIGSKTGELFPTDLGGITRRSTMGQIAKGNYRGKRLATNKYTYIRDRVDSWPSESTIIWCIYNYEQEQLEETFPDAASIAGVTKNADRLRLLDEFKSGNRKVLISKPSVLGFGLNLQVATRQVFSGLQDSYESFHQAVKRSNRIGSTKPLNVHIPVTEIEEPMIQTVLRKAKRIEHDTREQEQLFKECGYLFS